ncbi:RIP metalloprotease RseP [Acidocella sp.]|uniref:RIP metalloprotease RseP n=1 Tax=Acidocella sp. TaxID=50710 RepID=UPI0026302956|nr:RIP metalloprotease RseP [Acidocella sp.]
MLDTLRNILAFAVDIGVLIFIHELGHYLAARSQGVTVEVFSLGFGPALLKYKAKSGTVWQVTALPLGGYVKMQGWGETDPKAPVLPGSFSGASLSSRAVIVAAGPLANLALAVLLYAGLFMTAGYPTTPAVFSTVQAHSPAAAAQLLPGDRVLAIGGAPVRDFAALQQIIVAHPDADLDFTIGRAGKTFTDSVQIGAVQQGDQRIGHLGVAAAPVYSRLAPLPALVAAFHQTGAIIGDWGSEMGQLIVSHKGLSELSGPIGIAQVTGQVAAMGVASLVTLVAFLSINLGLVNLIPIPILDGGHLLFYAWEGLTRRQVPERVRELGLLFGGTLILMLFVVTTFNDLTRIGAVSWIAHLL